MLPSPFLERGYVVADTPGLASANPAHRRATLAYLPRVDAVLYLIDTQQPFSEGDASFLTLVGEHVRAAFVVQTKIDLWRNVEANGHAAWENARDRIAAHAARYAPGASCVAISAREYALGVVHDDAAMREQSGFPRLLELLDRSLDARIHAARASAAGERLRAIVADALAFAARATSRSRAHRRRSSRRSISSRSPRARSAIRMLARASTTRPSVQARSVRAGSTARASGCVRRSCA